MRAAKFDVGSSRDDDRSDHEQDELLMNRIRLGDEGAYQELLNRYWPRLVAYAGTIVDGCYGPEDIVQDTFVRVWRRRATWVPRGTVVGYLYRITRNLALNALRDTNVEHSRRVRAAGTIARTLTPVRPDETLTADSLQDDIERAIAALSPRRREVFVLSRFHGLSYRQIADTLGIAPQTVANQMAAALGELRESLTAYLKD